MARRKMYLPAIHGSGNTSQGGGSVEIPLNAQEREIARLMASHTEQRRKQCVLHPILCRVARAKCKDMARRGYFAHVDPDGVGANWLVRQAGYELPSFYAQGRDGNSIESLHGGYDTAATAWQSWMGSKYHHDHLLAWDGGSYPMFALQTMVGVGYFHDANSKLKNYWIVISCPPMGGE